MNILPMILVLLAGWESVGPSGGEVLAVLQSNQNPDILYALSGFAPTMVISSEDKGGSWVTISNFDSYEAPKEMTMTSDGKMVAVGANHIWVSGDGGMSWSNDYFWDYSFYDVVPHLENENELFAAGRIESSGRITYFHSTDCGSTWDATVLKDSLQSYGLCIAVSASDPDVILVGGYSFEMVWEPYLFRSVDGGGTFTEVTATEMLGENRIHGVGIHPDNPDIMLAGTKSGIYPLD